MHKKLVRLVRLIAIALLVLAPLAAAASGVWAHGRAGALLASEIGESGALATDIANALPRALREIVEGR